MIIRVGMEEDPGNRYTAWALDFPGCFAYGADEAEALLNLPRALLEFDYWVRLHIEKPWYELDGLDFHVDETFVVTRVDHNAEEYEINAFFLDDLRPLSAEELKQTDLVFSWQHEELLAGVEFVDRPKLEEIQPGERWSILGILGHLAQAEVWYLQNLGLDVKYPPTAVKSLDAIEYSYQLVRQYLPNFEGSVKITSYAQEQWSARKFVRRLLWHRRDHIDHIRKLLGVSLQ